MRTLRESGAQFLTRGSRYFKTDLFYLTKGSFWLSLGKGSTVLMGLALSVAFANLIPPEVYGNYRFVLSLAGIVGAFTLTGMATAVTQSVALGEDNVLLSAFWTHLRWSIGVTLASAVGALYYFINDNNTFALSLLIVGSFSPFLESSRLYNSYLIGKKDFRKNALLGIPRKLVPSIAMFGALLLTNNPTLLVLAYFSANTVVMLSLFFSVSKTLENSSQQRDNRAVVSYSKHLSVMNVIGSVSGHLDKILIFHFLGAAPLAAYSFALLAPNQLRSLSQILKTLVMPRLTTRKIPDLKEQIPHKALLAFVVTLFITILYIVLAPLLFSLLFPQYTDAVIYSQVYALVILFVPITFYGQTFVAHQKKRELYIIKTIGPVLRILLLLTLLPFFGIWGALVAILATKMVSVLVMLYLFRKL